MGRGASARTYDELALPVRRRIMFAGEHTCKVTKPQTNQPQSHLTGWAMLCFDIGTAVRPGFPHCLGACVHVSTPI